MSTAAAAQAARGDRTDHELVGLVRAGDDRAFELLYERYGTRVGAYVGGMVRDRGLAEDLTQEIFMSALRRMRETERPIAFRPWVYEIARNACIDQFRRTRRMEEVSYSGDDGLPGPDDRRGLTSAIAAPDDALEAKEELTNLCSAFGGLSDSHHEILVLRELEGLSYREIGERMGLSRPAVESTLFRARRRLTEEYDELASGRRCLRVQSILAGAAEGILGARDRRRLARHLSHCQPCRRQALALGVEDVLPARRGVAGRLAALLPVPWFLRRSRGGGQTATSGAGANQGVWSQWSTALAPAAEPIAAAWKGAAAIAAIALAGVATEVVRQGSPPPAKPAVGSATTDRGGADATSPGITALTIGSAAGSSTASGVAKSAAPQSRASGPSSDPGDADSGTASSPASAPAAVGPSPSWEGAPTADLSAPSAPDPPSGPSAPSPPPPPLLPPVGEGTAPPVTPPAPPAAAFPAVPTDTEAPSAPETPDAGAPALDPAELPTSASQSEDEGDKAEDKDEDESKDGAEEEREPGDDRDT